jgi:hypothetical protein
LDLETISELPWRWLAIGNFLQEITEHFKIYDFVDEKMNPVHYETLQLRRHAIQQVLVKIFHVNAMNGAVAKIEESKMNNGLKAGNLSEQVVVLVTLINVVSTTQHQRRCIFLEGFQDCRITIKIVHPRHGKLGKERQNFLGPEPIANDGLYQNMNGKVRNDFRQ